jgi:type 1 fimbriae regulatory protein FimB
MKDDLVIDGKERNFLTEFEIDEMLAAAKKGRYGVRDHLMVLLTYRHALRVSELIDVRLRDLDLDGARIHVRRRKKSLSTNQPLEGDELRAIRAYLRERGDTKSPYLFLGERGPMTRQAVNYLFGEIGLRAGLEIHVHPHMLRHSTGFYLANKGYDTRLIQDYLGHRNIRHTQIYTRTAAFRFEGLWR